MRMMLGFTRRHLLNGHETGELTGDQFRFVVEKFTELWTLSFPDGGRVVNYHATPAEIREQKLPRKFAAPVETSLPGGANVDGPRNGQVWWKGKAWEVPKGVVYRLIELLWHRQTVPYDEIDGENSTADATKRTYFSRTNAELKKIGVPWRIQGDALQQLARKRLLPRATTAR